MFKYRTDVVFDWLDLMGLKILAIAFNSCKYFEFSIVGFGGIAGLFLGCSLMSIAEVIFYLGIGIMVALRKLIGINLRIK